MSDPEPEIRPPGTRTLGLAVAGFIVLVIVGSAAFMLGSRPAPPSPAPTPARPKLRVLAAASLAQPLKAIANAADAAEIELSFAASSVHERQIASGTEVDVFIAAAAGPVDRLIAQNLLESDSRRTIAENSLVLVVPAGGKPVADLTSLGGFERIAVGAKGVPVGDYAREALEHAGVLGQLDPKLASYPDEPSVLTAVANGGAPAGFVYGSSVKTASAGDPSASPVVVALKVDPTLHSRIVYVAAISRSSKESATARAFVQGFGSDSWRQKLVAAGFLLPRAP